MRTNQYKTWMVLEPFKYMPILLPVINGTLHFGDTTMMIPDAEDFKNMSTYSISIAYLSQ